MLKSDSRRDTTSRLLLDDGMRDEQDAYGLEIMNFLNYKLGFEEIERDDGTVLLSGGPQMYFDPFRCWPVQTR